MTPFAAASLAGLLAAGQIQNPPSTISEDEMDVQGQQFIQSLIMPAIEDMKGSLGRQMQMNQRLNHAVLSEVKFKDASLQDVVAYLQQASKNLDKDETPLNILVLPAATQQAQGRTVTLQMTNVPLGQVLRYATEMLGLTYRLDEYAVVITPPQALPQIPASRNLARPDPPAAPAQP